MTIKWNNIPMLRGMLCHKSFPASLYFTGGVLVLCALLNLVYSEIVFTIKTLNITLFISSLLGMIFFAKTKFSRLDLGANLLYLSLFSGVTFLVWNWAHELTIKTMLSGALFFVALLLVSRVVQLSRFMFQFEKGRSLVGLVLIGVVMMSMSLHSFILLALGVGIVVGSKFYGEILGVTLEDEVDIPQIEFNSQKKALDLRITQIQRGFLAILGAYLIISLLWLSCMSLIPMPFWKLLAITVGMLVIGYFLLKVQTKSSISLLVVGMLIFLTLDVLIFSTHSIEKGTSDLYMFEQLVYIAFALKSALTLLIFLPAMHQYIKDPDVKLRSYLITKYAAYGALFGALLFTFLVSWSLEAFFGLFCLLVCGLLVSWGVLHKRKGTNTDTAGGSPKTVKGLPLDYFTDLLNEKDRFSGGEISFLLEVCPAEVMKHSARYSTMNDEVQKVIYDFKAQYRYAVDAELDHELIQDKYFYLNKNKRSIMALNQITAVDTKRLSKTDYLKHLTNSLLVEEKNTGAKLIKEHRAAELTTEINALSVERHEELLKSTLFSLHGVYDPHLVTRCYYHLGSKALWFPLIEYFSAIPNFQAKDLISLYRKATEERPAKEHILWILAHLKSSSAKDFLLERMKDPNDENSQLAHELFLGSQFTLNENETPYFIQVARSIMDEILLFLEFLECEHQGNTLFRDMVKYEIDQKYLEFARILGAATDKTIALDLYQNWKQKKVSQVVHGLGILQLNHPHELSEYAELLFKSNSRKKTIQSINQVLPREKKFDYFKALKRINLSKRISKNEALRMLAVKQLEVEFSEEIQWTTNRNVVSHGLLEDKWKQLSNAGYLAAIPVFLLMELLQVVKPRKDQPQCCFLANGQLVISQDNDSFPEEDVIIRVDKRDFIQLGRSYPNFLVDVFGLLMVKEKMHLKAS